jgi:hypothetical protein
VKRKTIVPDDYADVLAASRSYRQGLNHARMNQRIRRVERYHASRNQ